MDRRIVTGVLVGALAPAFVLTHTAVDRYRNRRLNLAAEWSARGTADLPAHPETAVTDFETALAFGPDRTSDRFFLAKALIASNRHGEANAQLETLLVDEPAKGEINLELARLAAAATDVTAAIRYYDAAIDGTWDANGTESRRQVRLEFARWLAAHGQPGLAQAQLIALADDLPPDPVQMTSVAELLADTGATGRALSLLRKALELSPSNSAASALAGEIEFRNGNVRAARADLAAAASHGALDDRAKDALDVSERVLALDPYASGIGSRSRLDRIRRAFMTAEARMNRCESAPSGSPVRARIDALTPRVSEIAKQEARGADRDPDFMDTAMAVVFDVERLPSDACGGDTADDRALALLANQRTSSPQ